MTKKEKIETKDWTYVGEVKNGKPHGKGKLKMQGVDGAMDIYVGEFKNDKFHGKGTLTENVGGQYEGYQKNLKHIGIWKNGKSMKGKSIYQDGTKYEGDWSDENLAQGYGKITYPNGGKFVGKFYYDEPIKGEGVIHWNDAKYIGEMRTKNGSCDSHGEGIMIFKNGDRYEGKFKDGRLDVATNFKISTKDVTWLYKGKLSKSGELVAEGKGAMKIFINTKPKDYCYEEGTFKNHALNGKGIRINYHDKKLTRPKSIYKGEFKMGNMDGRALYWQYPCDWYHEGRFSKNNYIDDVNKTKKLSKKVLNLIKFAHNLEKKY